MSASSNHCYVCLVCHAGPFESWSAECPGCHRPSLVATAKQMQGRTFGEGTYLPQPRRRAAPKALPDFLANHRNSPRKVWGYDALRLPWSAVVALHGFPGSGKSTVGTTAAYKLADDGTPVLYVSAEEGFSDTVAERFRRVIANLGGRVGDRPPKLLTLSDARTVAEVERDVASWGGRGKGVIVLDSVTELRPAPDWVAGLAVDHGLLLVTHLTTSGAPRGGWETAYAADVVVEVNAMVATTTKSRWSACTSWRVDEPITAGPRMGDVISLPGVRHE